MPSPVRLISLSGLLPLMFALVTAGCSDGATRRGDGTPRPSTPDAGTSADGGGNAPIGAESLGTDCTAACGSGDERKCSQETEICPICLVDPSHPLVAYCSQDCTNAPCPTGWMCEEIKTFGREALWSVLRGCVAEPAVCGDGVVQLGEICDGDDPQLGRCENCQGFAARCGDGVVQPSEVCDGDGPDGYCVDDCQRRIQPRFDFRPTRMTIATLREPVSGIAFQTSAQMGDLPAAGDADGCGSVQIISSTADAVRLRWRVCARDRSPAPQEMGGATIEFAVPRTETDLSRVNDLPPPLQPEVRIFGADFVDSLIVTIPGANLFVEPVEAPAHVRGRLAFFNFELEDASVDFDLNFDLWLPPPQ